MSQEVSIRTNPQAVNATTLGAIQTTSSKAIARWVVVGACLGLAWGVALRAWMVVLALKFGEQPQFTWRGTFGGILLPSALVGAWLGGAAHAAQTSGNKRWRWAILSPLVMVLAPAVLTEDFIPTLLATGLGGGAIGVGLIGLLGGYALSGSGMSWLRWLSGLLALLLSLASGAGLFFVNGVADISQSAGKAFGALLFILIMAVPIAGVGAPFRCRSK